jgi:hypothetical protein
MYCQRSSGASVAEDHDAVQVVAARVRGPLEADERGEGPRGVVLFGESHDLVPGGAGHLRVVEGQLAPEIEPLDEGVVALARFHHVVPFLAEGIRQDGRIGARDEGCQAEELRVVGHHEKIEGPVQLGALACRRSDFFPLGKAVGLAGTDGLSCHPRVRRVRRV